MPEDDSIAQQGEQGPSSPALRQYWTKAVSELATLPSVAMSEGLQERHRILSLCLMAVVARYWNGNKYGAFGLYPWRERQRLAGHDESDGCYRGAPRLRPDAEDYDLDYLGHNIACLAVDGRGEIIDFDFNHNEVLDSSVEHAESRLVRRVFSLTQIYDNWATGAEDAKREGREYSNILSDVTIYTSLESCAQCAGIMALGRVKEVVYLQTDPGMYWIGNILYNLTHVPDEPGQALKLPSPRPIAARDFGLEHFHALDRGFQAFRQEVVGKPFFRRKGQPDNRSTSITSFLCTDAALEIYERARAEYEHYEVRHPGRPPELQAVEAGLTNEEVLARSRKFYDYAITSGNRGTPHKL